MARAGGTPAHGFTAGGTPTNGFATNGTPKMRDAFGGKSGDGQSFTKQDS
eukprot:CAMPEP_0197691222 /NCGR_PEP_ID=MMETSP1338-20131121/109420_1 /TAXON_ID=43686 ORGANISM="Pelagodinium beii, Strain RCC1491" /NCGR_SAMPLE_ID=MMETSP1338 /ASSEMBLY_ACC=CAM_ASM_000754 /LENGTH=49 /DNA_ID= /DNA_START= /DNA_END= /DNA_ORIENTATION=